MLTDNYEQAVAMVRDDRAQAMAVLGSPFHRDIASMCISSQAMRSITLTGALLTTTLLNTIFLREKYQIHAIDFLV